MSGPTTGDQGLPEKEEDETGAPGLEDAVTEAMAEAGMADEMAHAASSSSPTFRQLADEGDGPPAQDLGRLQAERDEYLDALRRLQAEFENYKKRVIKQQTEHLERAAEGLVSKLLGVLDTLELALAHAAHDEAGGPDVEVRAVAQVSAMVNEVLAKEGLERIDPLGQRFDPTEHDAVLHEDGEGPPQVSEVLRAGYRWKGRVLRPAMVKVTG